jgi:predicted DNA-binding WGR domain protein
MSAGEAANTETLYWEIHHGVERPRFYEVRLEGDEVGGWRVVRRWGYLGCRGWRQVHRHEERAAAERELAAVGRRRARQGYQDAAAAAGPPAQGRQLVIVYEVTRMRGSTSG